jgi:hypothetical protein
MTATLPETKIACEYGVRVYSPDDTCSQVITCDNLTGAESLLAAPPRGFIAMEIVSRPAPAWETAPEGLIASVRALAEQYLDEEVGDVAVGVRLGRWLPGRDIEATLSGPWPELLEDIESYRKADDGDVDWAIVEPEFRDQELFVQHRDGLVIDAIKRLLGERR